MTIGDWLTILAILAAPAVAIQVSLWLAKNQEKRQRRLTIFRALMGTRASTLAREHVQALNVVDVDFYGSDNKSRAVVDALKVYLDHLNSGPVDQAWGTKRAELLVDLLQTMATQLGYQFDKTEIKRTSYMPSGYGDAELDYQEVRKLLLALLRGERGLPVYTPADQQPERLPPSGGPDASPRGLPKHKNLRG